MRKTDTENNEVAAAANARRTIRTVSGLVIAIGGVVFAILNTESATLGFVVALVGAGIVEPSHILNGTKK